MVAGYGAFTAAQAAGQGFVSAFVEGGKAFLQSVVGMGGKEGAGQAGTAVDAAQTGEAIVQTGENLTALSEGTGALVEGATSTGGGVLQQGAAAEGAGSMAFGPGSTGDVMQRSVQAGGRGGGQGAMLPEMAGDAAKVAELTKTGSQLQQGVEQGNWLSRAADAGKSFAGGLKDFAMSEGGGQVAGSLIKGVGDYYTVKDQQEFQDRIRREWAQGGRNPNIQNIRSASSRVGNIPAPSAAGIISAGRAAANQEAQRPYFQRPYGATAGTGG